MYVSGLTKDTARSEQTLRVVSIIVNGNDTYTYKLDDYDGVGGLVDIFVDEKDLTITFVQPQ